MKKNTNNPKSKISKASSRSLYPKEYQGIITDLIDDISKKQPLNTAVSYQNSSLTYKELNEKSDHLAQFLINNGMEPGNIIALSIEKSIDLIIGILGIMKAGGVYLPLDPSYPKSRLTTILENSKAKFLLTNKKNSSLFRSFQNKIIFLDQSWENELSHKKQFDDFPPLSPNDLAYVIYTSGSTGQPKGVMLKHEGLTNVVVSRMEYYPEPIKTILLGSISFDMSIMTIFHALASGGTLFIPKNTPYFDIEQTYKFIDNNSIDYLLCVPSIYLSIVQKQYRLPSLRYVILAGENLTTPIVNKHVKLHPQSFLYNEYGPTECTICSTIAKIYDPECGKPEEISIGKPIQNTEFYILDNNMRPVPDGKKGEIYIGGKGLALGYINLASKTLEKFVTISIPNKSCLVTLYRSGDLGKKLPNGNFEFSGRMDNQVKIRGHRIELGEIEYSISQHPDITGAVVNVHTDAKDNKYLIAYFSSSISIDSSKLKRYLSKSLTPYMLPSYFIHLNKFPLTPNGKIDRKALPLPKLKDKSEEPLVHPQSDLENNLLSIWKEVLSHKEISLQDNFFDIGGDSLSIAIVQTALKERHGINLPIVDLFKKPTIAKLAQHLDRGERSNKKIISLNQQLRGNKRKIAFKRFRKDFSQKLKKYG